MHGRPTEVPSRVTARSRSYSLRFREPLNSWKAAVSAPRKVPPMARPPTWLPRLLLIRRAVAHSVRSHYERKDLERLFELQPRAAQNLLALLPTVPIGKAHLVEREALVSFLDQVHEADDPIALMDRLRRERAAPTRKKLRFLIPRDAEPGDLASLPLHVHLTRGHLALSFQTLEELGESLFAIARLLEGDLGELAEALEPVDTSALPDIHEEGDGMRALFRELEMLETEHRLNATPQ